MVRVYFATNRNPSGEDDFDCMFHPRGPAHLRLGYAEAVAKHADDYEVTAVHVAAEHIVQIEDPDERYEKSTLGSKTIFEEIRREMAENERDVICLIHGFAADFRTSLARAAEIGVDYGREKPLIPMVFSWPANGSMTPWLDYLSDRDEARLSGAGLARAFMKLVQFVEKLDVDLRCRRRIHLVAHSMGNWALQNALAEIVREYGGRPPRLFENIFLMAADADNDAFEDDEKLKRLPDLCKAIHVYFSEDDRALMISDVSKFNPDRLGATGPRVRDSLPRKVNLIDCRHVDQPDRTSEEKGQLWDLSVHQYYRLRQEVIEDVRQVVAGAGPHDVLGRRYLPEDRSFQIVPFETRPDEPRPA